MVGPHSTRHNDPAAPTPGLYKVTESIAVPNARHGTVHLEPGDVIGVCSVGRVTVLVSTPDCSSVRIRCSTLECSAERVA